MPILDRQICLSGKLNSNCDKTHKNKLWENTKYKLWQNLKTQIVTKLESSNHELTKQHKLWQNSKTHIGTNTSSLIVTKLENSNCCLTKKLELWLDSTNWNATSLKNQIDQIQRIKLCQSKEVIFFLVLIELKLKFWPNSRN